jgi:hypothetical protein
MNETVVAAIADGFLNGFPHPGGTATEQPAHLIDIRFRTKGMPPHFQEQARAVATAQAEGIVYLIENQLDCTIIPNTELAELKQTTNSP